MARVDIFGTYHIDRPKKVEEELREFSSEVEIFFTEEPQEEADQSDWKTLRIHNPTVWIAGLLLNFFWRTGGFLLTRRFNPVDAVVSKKIARERGLEVLPVDETIVKRASEVSLLLTVFSWIWVALTMVVVAFAIVLWPKTLLVYDLPLSSVFFVSSAVMMGFIPVVPLAYLTLEERNDVIADNIENILQERGEPSRGCLIVGHKHLDGVVEALEERAVDVGKTHKPKFFRKTH